MILIKNLPDSVIRITLILVSKNHPYSCFLCIKDCSQRCSKPDKLFKEEKYNQLEALSLSEW